MAEEELSEEDVKLKEDLELLVVRAADADVGVAKLAVESLGDQIRCLRARSSRGGLGDVSKPCACAGARLGVPGAGGGQRRRARQPTGLAERPPEGGGASSHRRVCWRHPREIWHRNGAAGSSARAEALPSAVAAIVAGVGRRCPPLFQALRSPLLLLRFKLHVSVLLVAGPPPAA